METLSCLDFKVLPLALPLAGSKGNVRRIQFSTISCWRVTVNRHRQNILSMNYTHPVCIIISIRVIFSHLKLLNVVEFFVAPNCHFLCGHSYPPPAKSLTPNFIVNNLAFVSVDIDIFTTSAHWRYFCIRVTVCKK